MKNRVKIVKFILVSFMTMSLSSCATMINGTSQQVNISSYPQGAIASITPTDYVTARKAIEVKEPAETGSFTQITQSASEKELAKPLEVTPSETIALEDTSSTITGKEDVGATEARETAPKPAPVTMATFATVRTVTPSSVTLSRKDSYEVLFEKPECKPVKVIINRVVSGAVAIDLIWFPVGTIIVGIYDFASGGAYKLEPENIHVNLDCSNK